MLAKVPSMLVFSVDISAQMTCVPQTLGTNVLRSQFIYPLICLCYNPSPQYEMAFATPL